MRPETEKSSCLSDHKAGSRGVNCFPTEKELVQANHQLKLQGEARWVVGRFGRAGEESGGSPSRNLIRPRGEGVEISFQDVHTHAQSNLRLLQQQRKARKINNQPRQR